MKKFYALLFFFLIFCGSTFAQKEIVSTATGFIVAKKYSTANRYLDSLLKKNPKNVDALMMKGNVVLNCALDTTRLMNFISETDESVFTNEISEKPKLLSKKTVGQVEKFWNKCLRIDSTRADVIKGLCTVYSMALMKDSLEKEILQLVKTEKDDGEQAFRICEYARKLKERNRLVDAMDLYEFIAEQFPNTAGVRCDIASEYFYAGKMNSALLWLDSCYRLKDIDETSFLNGAFTYSLLGYYDDAMTVLSVYSKKFNRKMATYYYGLMLFSNSSARCFDVLNEFCNATDSNSYTNEFYLAKKLLAVRDSFSIGDYKSLTEDPNIPDYYKVLIHQRALRQFKNACEPFLNYGVLQSSLKNYAAAIQFLEEGEQCKMNAGQAEFWMLHYAYDLFMNGEKAKAAVYFKPLQRSATPFTQQAAKYFSAKILLSDNKKEEAKNLLVEVAASKTKFAELAKQSLQ